MGMFSVIIYGIIFGAWAGALGYDILYMPRLYKQWWVAKLCFITMINFVSSFCVPIRFLILIDLSRGRNQICGRRRGYGFRSLLGTPK